MKCVCVIARESSRDSKRQAKRLSAFHLLHLVHYSTVHSRLITREALGMDFADTAARKLLRGVAVASA